MLGIGCWMRNFRELKVWHKAHQLVLELYKVTSGFPAEERYGLVSQLRRSAASIPANIAEGCGRNGNRDFSRFMSIAAGSACETEYHLFLFLAYELGNLEEEAYILLEKKINEIKPMLNRFIQHLSANP